jgi:hypothetical protein
MRIITSVVNNVDFIEIQYYTLKKYFKGDYDFIVFNDAKDFPDFTNDGDVTIKRQIEELCQKLNIQCINIPNNHHKNLVMSERHVDTFNNHVLSYQRKNPDKYLLLDSDMFLIDYFDINKWINYESAIVLQSRNNTGYLWPGLCYLDFTKMKNIDLFDWSICPGFDSGGMTKEWLKLQMSENTMPNTDEIRWTNKEFHTKTIYFIKHLWSCSWNQDELPNNLRDNKKLIDFFTKDIRNKNGKFFCEIYDNVFLHYRAGGNWLREGLHIHKMLTEQLKEALL